MPNGDYDQSVMVALLPMTTDWAKVEYPHLTVVYVGLIADLRPTDFNELGKTVSDIAVRQRPIQLQVLGRDVFGEELDKVDVLLLRGTTELMLIRRRLEEWSASSWPYRPHVTVGPEGTLEKMAQDPPPAIAFDRIVVSWGDQRMQFWLNPHM